MRHRVSVPQPPSLLQTADVMLAVSLSRTAPLSPLLAPERGISKPGGNDVRFGDDYCIDTALICPELKDPTCSTQNLPDLTPTL